MPYPLINGALINGDGSASSGPGDAPLRPIGFRSTKYGTPGIVLDITLRIRSLAVETRMGTPVFVLRNDSVAQPPLMVPALARLVRCGTPVARPDLVVVSTPRASTLRYGTPRVGAGLVPEGFQSTQYGAARVALIAHAGGVQSTRMGAPTAQRVVLAGYLPGLRYGVPRVAGAAGILTQGFMATEFGLPSIHRVARALPAAPSARFGRPTLMRNSQC